MAISKTHPDSQKRKIIIFSDFDGTIFLQDTGHILVDHLGCGAAYRNKLEEQFKSGERTFRDISDDMWGSLSIPFGDGFDIMEKNLKMDPGFREFHQYCVREGFPFNVISAGLKPVLQRTLDMFLGEKEVCFPSSKRFPPQPPINQQPADQFQSISHIPSPPTNPPQASSIEIVANDLKAPGGIPWKPVWRDNTASGHDKAASVNLARTKAQEECEPDEIPLIVFIGDGVSDLAAAREADVLFARRGLRLEEYCIEHGIQYTPFDSFADVKREVEAISLEDQKKTGGVGKPVRYNPRANMWRRISSKEAVPTLMATATPTRDEKVALWPDYFSEPKQHTEPTIQE
jgi:2-hydroxy-3-keto-5-methylthiopentenyl-1-phosphate phosphatase